MVEIKNRLTFSAILLLLSIYGFSSFALDRKRVPTIKLCVDAFSGSPSTGPQSTGNQLQRATQVPGSNLIVVDPQFNLAAPTVIEYVHLKSTAGTPHLVPELLESEAFVAFSSRLTTPGGQQSVNFELLPQGSIEYQMRQSQLVGFNAAPVKKIGGVRTATDLLIEMRGRTALIESGTLSREKLALHATQGYPLVTAVTFEQKVAQMAKQGVSVHEAVISYVNATVSPSLREARDVMQTIYRNSIQDQTIVREAVAAYNLISTAQGSNQIASVPLATIGINSYFQFIPEGKTTLVSARVLNLHSTLLKNGNWSRTADIVLVEWLEESTEEGKRIRHVQTLSKSEVGTVISNPNRTKVRQDFIDSLSLLEIRTLRLAEQHGLKVYSYDDAIRGQVGYSDYDPFSAMGRLHYLGLSGGRNLEFWRTQVKPFLTPSESQKNEFNLIDVFSRIQPDHTLRIICEQNQDAVFDWIIGADGKLKVAFRGDLDRADPAKLLRLAHGRGLFAGGSLKSNGQGQLEISINAEGYRPGHGHQGESIFTSSENGDVYSFVISTFHLQGRAPIATLQGRNIEFYKSNYLNFMNKKPIEWQFFFDGVAQWRKGKTNTKSSIETILGETSFKKIEWNKSDETQFPISFSEWQATILQLNNWSEWPALLPIKSQRIWWSYYVFGENLNSPKSSILQSKRKLYFRATYGAGVGNDSSHNSISHARRVLVGSASDIMDAVWEETSESK